MTALSPNPDNELATAMRRLAVEAEAAKAERAQKLQQARIEQLERGRETRRQNIIKNGGAPYRRADRILEEEDPIAALERKAIVEVNKQLSHTHAQVRRDASKTALELARGRYKEQVDASVDEIVYVTRAYTPEDERKLRKARKQK